MSSGKEKPRVAVTNTGRSNVSNFDDRNNALLVEGIKSRLSMEELLKRNGHNLQREGDHFKTLCPFHTEKTASCHVYPDHFHCFGCGAHGDIISYVRQRDGCGFREAVERLAREVGVSLPPEKFNRKSVAPPQQNLQNLQKSNVGGSFVGFEGFATGAKALPQDDSWQEPWCKGVEYLKQNPFLQVKLAKWRGWSQDTVNGLVEDGMVSAPLYYGERGIAFRVDHPLMTDLNIFATDMVGYHIRLKPKNKSERAQWRFVPQGIPSLPFILGDFSTAKLLIITEGQWDAISFCIASHWLSHDAAWPDWICVIGIRGAQGSNVFLRHYRSFWPHNVKCLLLPDNDPAGATWFESKTEAKTFAEQLVGLCSRVVVAQIPEAKDFNEALQNGLVSLEELGLYFLENNFTDKGGLVL